MRRDSRDDGTVEYVALGRGRMPQPPTRQDGAD
jgi:hypothetical protein